MLDRSNHQRGDTPAARRALALVAAFVLAGACQPQMAQVPATEQPGHDRDPSDIDPDSGDNGVIPEADLYPSTFPTIAQIDWDAFPAPLTHHSAVAGKLIWVSNDGDNDGQGTVEAPFLNIWRGLAEAGPGDWVVVRGGTYPEAPPGEYRALNFESDKAGVTVTAYQGETVTVTPGADGINYGLDIGASGVRVNGLDFEGFPNAMALLGRVGQVIEDVVISNAEFRVAPAGAAQGIAMVSDNGGDPVVDGVLLHRVSVTGATIGIQCNHGPCNGLRFEGVYVDNGEGEGSGADTIAVESGSNIVIIDTEVTNAAADGIDLKASDVLVVGAFVHHVQRNGLKLWQGGDVIDTVVTHTGADAAVVFDRPGRYRLLNSVVGYHNWNGLNSYVMTVGYDVPGHFEVELVNSVFFRTAGAVFVNRNATLRVQNCSFSEASNRVAIEGPARGRLRLITYDQGPDTFVSLGWGDGNLLDVDPQFIGPDDGDYHLAAQSPLIDAGLTADDAPTGTATGATRVRGDAIDIGAYEF